MVFLSKFVVSKVELLVRLNLNLIFLVIFNESERLLIYFLAVVARSKGIIITNVIKTEGLNNQYRSPSEKTRSQNSFLCNIFIKR